MAELRWYLENFLDYPFPPETDRAEQVQEALKQWGTEVFQGIFSTRSGARFYDEASKMGHDRLCIQVSSDDPGVLAWPWEAIHDPEVGFLAQTCQIERKLNYVRDPLPISNDLPRDRVNILLVTARPYKGDVHYRSLSRPIVELIEKQKLPASVHLLRPPTFDRLREHLRENPYLYHVLHFDGHGAYGTEAGNRSCGFILGGNQGHLIFENEDGSPYPISAEQLSPLLREYAVPCVVLNACQSGMVDRSARDPFASVAASLLRSGVRIVLAMAYSLYVSGGQEFLPSFYQRLFDTGSPAEATRAGRQQMFARRGRVCARGRFPLQDWLVPVLYRQDALDLPFVASTRIETPVKGAKLPSEAKDEQNPYGFIGRDRALLELERAIRKRTPSVLVHGLGGIGKTTLARGFLAWLEATDGSGEGIFWFGFQDIRTAEYVFNRMGEALLGQEFQSANLTERISVLVDLFRERRFFIIWDNFEAVKGISGTEIQPVLSESDQTLLLDFLRRLRDGQSKVIITSRSEEEWLGIECVKLSLGGLENEERWEYCNAILGDLGIKINRDDKDLVDLMNYLGGHPLAMRVVLPKLEHLSAAQVLSALKSNLEMIESEGDEAQARLFATLRFATGSVPSDQRTLLVPLAFHEHFTSADLLEEMAKRADKTCTREQIDWFLQALTIAGVLNNKGNGLFEMHPALTGFLRSSFMKSIPSDQRDTWIRGFVDVMAMVADSLTAKKLHDKRATFFFFKSNFYNAMQQAQRLKLYNAYCATAQSLGVFAENTRNWREAATLFTNVAETSRNLNWPEMEAPAYQQLGRIARQQNHFETARKWCLRTLEITEKLGFDEGTALTYHELGIIAGKQRDFDTARGWYLKAQETKEKLADESGAADTYHQLGTIAQMQGDLRTAHDYYQKSLEIEERYGDEHGAAISYHQLGTIAMELGNLETARNFHLKALKIKKRQGNESGLAFSYHEMGNIALKQGHLESAQKWYIKALEIREQLGDEDGAAMTYHQMGVVAKDQENFETARKWCLKSLEIYQRLRNEYGVAKNYHQLGELAYKQGDIKSAEDWYLRSLEITKKDGNEHEAASTFFELGKIAIKREQFVAARDLYLKSAQLSEKYGNEHGSVLAYGSLGVLEGMQKRYLESGKWLAWISTEHKSANMSGTKN